MYHLLLYDYVEDVVEKRAPFREEHLKLARAAHERGEILMAGALADPVDGAVFVFKGEAATASGFALNDPYVKNGIVTRWRLRPWTVVIGG